jgi:serine protease Do
VTLVERLAPSVVSLVRGSETAGSGFVVRPRVVVTAAHVAKAVGSPLVIRAGATAQPARLVTLQEDDDIAILEVDAPLPPLALASHAPKVGEWIVVLGNPFGTGRTASVGIVSAVPGTITATPQLSRQIQINASVNPGNSGGPVCNLRGEVIGATTTFVAAGQGIAFVVAAARIGSLLSDAGY